MKFSVLKQSQQKYDVGDIDRIENKQRISLSRHAYEILMYDLGVFQTKHPQKQQDEINSDLLNDIFSNFKDEAKSSVVCAIQQKREEYLDSLAKVRDTDTKEEIITLLLKPYESELKKHLKRRVKDKDYPLIFRISKDNLAYLISDDGQREADAYSDNIGAYFKAVMEEYCEQPFVKREKIYCKQHINEITLAISNKKLLKVKHGGNIFLMSNPWNFSKIPNICIIT